MREKREGGERGRGRGGERERGRGRERGRERAGGNGSEKVGGETRKHTSDDGLPSAQVDVRVASAEHRVPITYSAVVLALLGWEKGMWGTEGEP